MLYLFSLLKTEQETSQTISSVHLGWSSQDGDSLTVTVNATHRQTRWRCAAELPVHLSAMTQANAGNSQGPRTPHPRWTIKFHSISLDCDRHCVSQRAEIYIENTEPIAIASTDFPLRQMQRTSQFWLRMCGVESGSRREQNKPVRAVRRPPIKQKRREEEKMRGKWVESFWFIANQQPATLLVTHWWVWNGSTLIHGADHRQSKCWADWTGTGTQIQKKIILI